MRAAGARKEHASRMRASQERPPRVSGGHGVRDDVGGASASAWARATGNRRHGSPPRRSTERAYGVLARRAAARSESPAAPGFPRARSATCRHICMHMCRSRGSGSPGTHQIQAFFARLHDSLHDEPRVPPAGPGLLIFVARVHAALALRGPLPAASSVPRNHRVPASGSLRIKRVSSRTCAKAPGPRRAAAVCRLESRAAARLILARAVASAH